MVDEGTCVVLQVDARVVRAGGSVVVDDGVVLNLRGCRIVEAAIEGDASGEVLDLVPLDHTPDKIHLKTQVLKNLDGTFANRRCHLINHACCKKGDRLRVRIVIKRCGHQKKLPDSLQR